MRKEFRPAKVLESYEVGPFRVNLIRDKSWMVEPPDPQLWSVDVWKGYHQEDWVSHAFSSETEARAHFVEVRDKLVVKTAQLALGL